LKSRQSPETGGGQGPHVKTGRENPKGRHRRRRGKNRGGPTRSEMNHKSISDAKWGDTSQRFVGGLFKKAQTAKMAGAKFGPLQKKKRKQPTKN